MEVKERFAIEVFLGLILIILLIVLVFLFTSFPDTISNNKEDPKTSQGVSISNSNVLNSFNTNTENHIPKTTLTNPRYNYKSTKPYSYKNIYTQQYSEQSRYHSYPEQRFAKGILGNPIDKYYVYVKNLDYKGNYFTVKFYFTDYHGNVKTTQITKYIRPFEERKFFYQDIYHDRYKHRFWTYKVVSGREVFSSRNL